MKAKILHESAGRIRVRVQQKHMTLEQADLLEYYFRKQDGIKDVQVFDRTCDVIVRYTCARSEVIAALGAFSYAEAKALDVVPDHTGRALSREYEDKIAASVLRRILCKTVVPAPMRAAIALIKSVKYIRHGISSLAQGKLDVSVLDATAITVSMLRGDFDTASSVMFLLGIGETLEEWTHKKSVDDLARTMSLHVDKVWCLVDGQEVLTPVNEVQVGDEIVVRTSNMIPLDGKVVSGEMTVNQASITGESLPVRKDAGTYVYAGTVVEEGTCVVRVDKNSGSGRYDRIVKMIEESEKLKSMSEDKASHLADKLVPYSLGGTALVYLLTGNATRALSVLMVDFSCALKLAMPLSVLSAMRESSTHHISVKGGRFLEAVSAADTIVLDKTGTLTHATPKVAKIIPFGENNENEMLRLAACLEEHYPHSMAKAVVQEAAKRDLKHEECHSEIEYVVAHGISSMVDKQRVLIGSYHFIFEDEKCTLREEAADVIDQLHALGIQNVVMMTGDNSKTANAVAAKLGIDTYYAEVLPEHKAEFVKAEHEAGRTVIMVGDGVNDSPALSEADAGIAISDGAAIAREIADITISADDLYTLVTLKKISDALMQRIDRNYRFIIGFNLGLILLGVAGVLQPATSVMLYNLSTLGISLDSMTNLLSE